MSPSVVQSAIVFTEVGVAFDQLCQCFNRNTLPALALYQDPFLKRRAIADGQAFQKVAPVDVDGLFAARDHLLRICRLWQSGKAFDIEPIVAGAVEANGLAGDVQKGLVWSVPVADDLAHVREAWLKVWRAWRSGKSGHSSPARLSRPCARCDSIAR